MDALVVYFTKSAGILLLFLGVYFLVLRRETFFQENRFFLLIGMLISLAMPFMVITKYIEIPVIATKTTGNFVYEATNISLETASFSWIQLLVYVYLAGVLFFFGKFLIELFSLFRLLWKSNIAKRDGQFIYIETNTSFSPFSFFKYIVYNPTLYSKTELEAILTHEQAHSRQLHSIDVFVSKLYCIFFWFNPFAWLHKKFMLQNLEFLADSTAIKQTPSKKTYQLTLLKVTGNSYCPALTNNFYNSLIKKRIVMLQKTKSTQINRWKQALILPLLLGFVFLFNTEVIAKEVMTTSDNNPIIETTAGDLVVVITKNTTMDELKAYKKLFKSQKIKFEYKDVKFNSKGEISGISMVLTSGKSEVANGKFATVDDKAISDIQLGKRGEELFIKSTGLGGSKKIKASYAYSFSSDDDDDDNKKFIIKTNKDGKTVKKTWIQKENVETIDIKNEDGKEIIVVNGKKLSPAETIEIKKEGDKEIIIIDGKRLNPDNIIEEEIEIKKEGTSGNTYTFSISTDDEEEEVEDKKLKIIKRENSKIIFNTSDGKEKPLYVIDGKVVSDDKFKGLDPDTIESVNVLKGKSAKELYGEKGKNGVIVVKTKK